jgi:CRISPR-associated endonuclease/helicase Cas3
MEEREGSLQLLLRALGVESAYAWQRQAFERLCDGDLPDQIKVPTSGGKTLFVPIWVAALAVQAKAVQARASAVRLPRRLVYVVNRRVLVDEVSGLADRILRSITSDPALLPIRNALAALSASGQALVISTLRGAAKDNGAWSLDPSTPAIILATPDMVGSRLLFRGYGVGRSRSATHAGMLGCDTLIVHDEAHLAPAFTALLRRIQELAEPGARRIGRPPMRVVEMTATLAASARGRPLICDVGADATLAARMSAPKRLKVVATTGSAVETIAGFALEHADANRAVAIFVSTPAVADKIAARLRKQGVAPERFAILTGTMRGHERAALMETPAMRRFDTGPNRSADGTAYFIATSAGEIGLDIDADIGLFDLTTLDRFIQRAGRVNRGGIGVGEIALVHAGGEELPEALRERAAAALRELDALPQRKGIADASPLALSRLCDRPGYADAIEPPPAQRSLEPAILGMLSMTSLRLDEIGCPGPDVFIHGLVEEDAEIRLAWRELPSRGADFAEWLDAWPLDAAMSHRSRNVRAGSPPSPAGFWRNRPVGVRIGTRNRTG